MDWVAPVLGAAGWFFIGHQIGLWRGRRQGWFRGVDDALGHIVRRAKAEQERHNADRRG